MHHQETARRIGKEGTDDRCPGIKEGNDIGRPAIAEMDPDHLGRGAKEKTPLPEIIVLRDNAKAMRPRVFPNDRVIRTSEANIADVDPSRERDRDQTREVRAQVLIEEERGHASGLRSRIGHQTALPIGRERERRPDILALQIREVGEDLVFGHSSGQIVEDVVHGDAKAADAGLATPLSRFNGDPTAIVHDSDYRTPSWETRARRARYTRSREPSCLWPAARQEAAEGYRWRREREACA